MDAHAFNEMLQPLTLGELAEVRQIVEAAIRQKEREAREKRQRLPEHLPG